MACTITEVKHTSMKKVTFAWTSTALGAATGTTSHAYDGRVVACVQIPDGVATPTDAYDVVVTDRDGVDVLHGLGADLTNAATTYKTEEDGLGAVAGSPLTITVANAGDTKSGQTILYIR